MDIIKPIKIIPPVVPAEIPETRVDRNRITPSRPSPIPSPQGEWNFTNGKIYLNGQDVSQLIEQGLKNSGIILSKLANDLDAFRQYYFRRNSQRKKKKVGDEIIEEEMDPTGELGQLSALVDALIGKIMRTIKKKYDQTKDGLAFELDKDGQLNLNGMNVTSFIAMARQYPGKKAKIFLKGLKNRLAVILSNKSRNPNYERIRGVVMRIYREIDREIERILEKDHLLEAKK